MTWTRHNHHDMHKRLCAVSLSERYEQGECGAQAIFCPYYVPLEGRLGADWGVIVNPESSRFGLLTFEHDDCGCPVSDTEDPEGWGRHSGAPNQQGDTWDEDWQHTCDAWCEAPCEEAVTA